MRGSAFFEDVRQTDVMIGEQPSKSPTFFFDASSFSAVFPAGYRALRELMPDPRYVPARLAPGLGVVAITYIEYRDSDIGPLREVGIAIPLNEAYFRANLPGRALMSARRLGQLHAFIRHAPVTSEVAVRGSLDFCNFPHFIAEIDFSETDEQAQCRLAERNEHILTLSGKRIPTPRSQRIDVFNHLWMDGQPQSAQVKFNQLQCGASWRRDAAVLELGERHQIALELRRLLVSRKPLYYEYVPRYEAILFAAEHQTPLLAQRSSQAIAAALEHHQLSG
jgi:hypothetical protein